MEERAAGKAAAAPLITLDIVRALAAFVVMVGHVRRAQWGELGDLPEAQKTLAVRLFYDLTSLGNVAVLVFFVLSGFLVGGKIIERVRGGRFRLGDYALDRVTRILIPLVPACLFTAAVMVFLLHQPVGAGQLLANMTGLNGALAPTLAANSALWSLPLEIWFYVLGAVVALWFARGPSWRLALILGVCALLFSQLGAAYLLFWTLGALMTLAVKMPRPGLVAIIGLVFAAAGAADFLFGPGNAAAVGTAAAPRGIGQSLVCIGFCLTLPFLCLPAVNRALAPLGRAAVSASAFSYTLYLFHYPINQALNLVFPHSAAIDGQAIGMGLARMALCVAGSLVFYVAFERNTQAVRRFLAARLGGRPRPAPPPLAGVAGAQADAGVGVAGLEPN